MAASRGALRDHLICARIVLIVSLAAIALVAPSAAHANQQAANFWHTTSDQGWMGSKVTVNNPAGSEMHVSSTDFASATAYADASPVDSLIQQGIIFFNNDPYGGSGTCTGFENQLMYFVEISHAGAHSCFTEGAATSTDSHVQQVLRGSAGNWRPYMDGQWKAGVQTSWDPCGGDACTVAAFAEENRAFLDTSWHAKFAGSGNTPWKFWNGTVWNTINHCSTGMDAYWAESGPFPDGIWSFIYRDGGNSSWTCP